MKMKTIDVPLVNLTGVDSRRKTKVSAWSIRIYLQGASHAQKLALVSGLNEVESSRTQRAIIMGLRKGLRIVKMAIIQNTKPLTGARDQCCPSRSKRAIGHRGRSLSASIPTPTFGRDRGTTTVLSPIYTLRFLPGVSKALSYPGMILACFRTSSKLYL